MSRRVADLLIKIGADSYQFQQKTKEVEKGIDQLAGKLHSVGKTMSLAVTAPLAAIGVTAVMAFDTVEKSAAKVRQAIDTTGGAAKLTLKELQSYAAELQNVTIFDDDKIMHEVTARLLSFTNIAGNTFKRTQAAALDLATVLDKDLGSITVQLGKALNDPVKNLSALSRMGIQFSKEQTQVIRAFVETNQLAEAQGLILDTLASRYGGQAQAAAKAGFGALQQLKNSWGDFLEQIGAIMMPVVVEIAKGLDSVVKALQNMDPKLRKFLVIAAGIAAALGPLALGLGSLLKALPLLKAGFTLLVAPITVVKTAIKNLSVAIAANPIGFLLTLITTGISLFMAFGDSTEEAAEANGELTNKIIDESRQVNLLIGKLSSATTSEKERKGALEELKRIQPDIVEGLNAESLELEILAKRASAYNQQLVLRIALARKQDQVAAAIEKQTEAGVKQAEKEAKLYTYLSEIGSKLASGDFEFGRRDPKKGFFEWEKASDHLQRNLINHFNAIMASGDTLAEKARKIQQMFRPGDRFRDKIRMDDVSTRQLGMLQVEIFQLEGEVSEAGKLVEQAESDVKNFADAFSLSLTSAVETAAGAVENLGGAASGASVNAKRSIAELNEEIKSLEEQKQESFDDKEIAKFNARIAELKKEVDRLNSIGVNTNGVKGKIAELNDEIKKLEEIKNRSFDVAQIAECNAQIAKLKNEVENLNKVLPRDLLPRSPLQPILSDYKPITLPLKIQLPDLKLPMLKAWEQMKQLRDFVKEQMYGWSDDISGAMTDDMIEVGDIVKTYVDALVEKGWTFSAALEHVGSTVSGIMKSFDDSLSNFLANSIVAAAEAIGQIMAGDMGFGGLMKAILLQFANFLKQIGTQLIEFAIMMIAFKTALKSVLANPWAALAVGAAMVITAAVMTALINKNAKANAPKLAKGGLAFGPTYAMVGDNPNARVDPEVIAPLSKLKNLMTGGGSHNLNIALSGQLVAKGRDLVYAIGKENFKTDVLGG